MMPKAPHLDEPLAGRRVVGRFSLGSLALFLGVGHPTDTKSH